MTDEMQYEARWLVAAGDADKEQIYISYAPGSCSFAKELGHMLHEELFLWVHFADTAGAVDLEKSLEGLIGGSDCLLLIVDRDYGTDEGCRHERDIAYSKGIPLLAVRMERDASFFDERFTGANGLKYIERFNAKTGEYKADKAFCKEIARELWMRRM